MRTHDPLGAGQPYGLVASAGHVSDGGLRQRPRGEAVSAGPPEAADSRVRSGRAAGADARYERLAVTDVVWEGGPEQEAAWECDGRQLAYALQDELADVEVRYWHGDGRDRGVRERGS